MVHEGDGDTNCNWSTGNNPQGIGKGTRRPGNKTTSRNHLNYSINKKDQNTEKSPGHLRKFAVTQTQVKNHLVTLV